MKNNFTPKVLVLGATGMLGRIIYKYLRIKNKNIFGTSRNKKNKRFIYLKVNNNTSLENIFIKNKFEYVVNCIGALEGSGASKLSRLNIKLPKKILKASRKYGFKIIHISTDAVFDKEKEDADETTIPNAKDPYGKSKLNGELLENSINIRTSIIGLDPIDHKGILEYVLQNRDKKIIGFENQIWTGSTALQLAKFIEWIISKNNFDNLYKKTKIIHFPPLGPTTKYEIIKTFAKLNGLSNVKKGNGQKIIRMLFTRYFDEIKLGNYSGNLEKEIKKLIEFEKIYAKKIK